MSSDNKPSKPTPSVAEINAYLEKSAARTKKRLTLAMGQKPPTPTAAQPTSKVSATKLPTTSTKVVPPASAEKVDAETWSPFESNPEENKGRD